MQLFKGLARMFTPPKAIRQALGSIAPFVNMIPGVGQLASPILQGMSKGWDKINFGDILSGGLGTMTGTQWQQAFGKDGAGIMKMMTGANPLMPSTPGGGGFDLSKVFGKDFAKYAPAIAGFLYGERGGPGRGPDKTQGAYNSFNEMIQKAIQDYSLENIRAGDRGVVDRARTEYGRATRIGNSNEEAMSRAGFGFEPDQLDTERAVGRSNREGMAARAVGDLQAQLGASELPRLSSMMNPILQMQLQSLGATQGLDNAYANRRKSQDAAVAKLLGLFDNLSSDGQGNVRGNTGGQQTANVFDPYAGGIGGDPELTSPVGGGAPGGNRYNLPPWESIMRGQYSQPGSEPGNGRFALPSYGGIRPTYNPFGRGAMSRYLRT